MAERAARREEMRREKAALKAKQARDTGKSSAKPGTAAKPTAKPGVAAKPAAKRPAPSAKPAVRPAAKPAKAAPAKKRK
jgi:hypothetical protein